MKVIDYINLSINAYPALDMLENYEESSFNVLHHSFIVLGNGVEWANTGDPKTSGYLVYPRYKEVKGECIRIKDKPYGEEKHELDPRIFKEDLFYFYEIDFERSEKGFLFGTKSTTLFKSEMDALRKKYMAEKCFDTVCDNKREYIHGFHTHYCSPVPKYSSRENPYPNFSKRYSCFWDTDPKLIQEDWRLAGIEHLEYWQKYFNDDERVKGYQHYKNSKSLEKWITTLYINNTKKSPDWIQSVRDDYGVQGFNGDNFEELATIRWEKDLQKTKAFLSGTIQRITI